MDDSSLTILLPYQREWIADTRQVKVCEKSRRVGITWCEAADRALVAASRAGMDTWYIGYNKDMALEFVETAAEWARRFDRAARAIEEIAIADQSRDILAYRIRFASGHKIVALSSRPSNLRGKQGCAVIDEAAFHDDLPGLLKAALAFTMWGGYVHVISTHNGAENPFNELVTEIRAGRRPYSLHRITFDEAVTQGLYRKIAERAGVAWSEKGEAEWRREIVEYYGDNAEEELGCIPRARAGAFLSSVLVESRMSADAPVVRWETAAEFAERPEAERRAETQAFLEDRLKPLLDALDGELPTCFGEDFGRSGDLTVIWPLQIGRDLKRRTPFVVELRNVPFRQQEQILFYIADRMPRMVAAAMDARGNGQYLAETARQRYGARVANVMLSTEWYRENMPRFKAAFEDGTIEIPRDPDILLDCRAIIVEGGVAHVGERRVRGTDLKPRHGDSAIAAALAYFASRLDTAEIDYRPAPRLNARARDPFGAAPTEDRVAGASGRGRLFEAGAW
jgi:phage FluMu gp28-like protein